MIPPALKSSMYITAHMVLIYYIEIPVGLNTYIIKKIIFILFKNKYLILIHILDFIR